MRNCSKCRVPFDPDRLAGCGLCGLDKCDACSADCARESCPHPASRAACTAPPGPIFTPGTIPMPKPTKAQIEYVVRVLQWLQQMPAPDDEIGAEMGDETDEPPPDLYPREG